MEQRRLDRRIRPPPHRRRSSGLERTAPNPRDRRGRLFTRELKAQTVDLLGTSGKSVGEVCRGLDLTETVERRWLAQGEIDAGRRDGLTTTEREELSRLRRENRVLRQEREIRRK